MNFEGLFSEIVAILAGIAGGGFWLSKLLINKSIRDAMIQIIFRFIRLLLFQKSYDHHLFTNLKQNLHLIENTTLETELKTELYQTILKIKYTTVTEYCEIWIKNRINKLNNLDRIDLQNSMKKLIRFMVSGDPARMNLYPGYETHILNALNQKYGVEKGYKYYKKVYLESFKPYHEENIKYINKPFESKDFFVFKGDNIALVNLFMENVSGALNRARYDLVDKLNELNGGLSKI